MTMRSSILYFKNEDKAREFFYGNHKASLEELKNRDVPASKEARNLADKLLNDYYSLSEEERELMLELMKPQLYGPYGPVSAWERVGVRVVIGRKK